ncbi:F-box-like domain superfamily [Arabidopsis thaliana x Arabidopsis arenosa]|uniref:F-box-like domain superfamily n=1 Tax=Arabidopsis thaliana x Arabidopsis arenosa TaxID=1240361 RepID=A0A8T1ZID2_9BRAS|nr:F-box-like domain superfamily [Arabidopsis thaliana x Arabidopsis arenosa]
MEQIHGGDSNSGGGGGGSSRSEEIAVTRASRFDTLPEDCISKVISHTSPRDACVVASVSKTVKSAAQSDLVWEMFLPSEYSSLVVARSANLLSKKEIFLSLANDSVLIEDGKKSFWLEKASGKKCFMLSAMDLTIIWGDAPAYWQWITVPESKFEKVAELRNVCWFEIRGKISCGMLSKGTHYSVYVVFKTATGRSYGFDSVPVEAGVGFVGKEATKKTVFLESGADSRSGVHYSGISHAAVSRAFRMRRPWMRVPREEEEVEGERERGRNVEGPKERVDGWSEVELGRFFIDNGGCDEIEISLMETQNGNWKSGLIIQGIEIRPV